MAPDAIMDENRLLEMAEFLSLSAQCVDSN